MHIPSANSERADPDSYLFGPRQAWFAYAMTVSLMIFDYVDRQVIVTIFPHLKAEWGLTDTELGGLVSIVSVIIALFSIPVALVADRSSRVKSIVVMALAWSLASMSCMFARNYALLFAARAMVGCGEAGYGPVGAALIVGHFPRRMHGSLLGRLLRIGLGRIRHWRSARRRHRGPLGLAGGVRRRGLSRPRARAAVSGGEGLSDGRSRRR